MASTRKKLKTQDSAYCITAVVANGFWHGELDRSKVSRVDRI